MDVQMREWSLRQCSLCRCIDLSTIRRHLLLDLRRHEIGGLQLGRLVLDGCRIGEFRADDHLQANHLKQAPGRGSHIVRRVVRIAKPFAEELLVELRQGRPLEFAAAPTRDGAVFGAFVLGVDDANPGERLGRLSKTEQFRTDHIDVEPNVVAHDVVGAGSVCHEFSHNFIQRRSFRQCAVGGDAVNFGGIEWNGKAVRPHNPIAARQQRPVLVVQLPGQLDQARPIVTV